MPIKRIRFDNPPVVEVVFGVQFDPSRLPLRSPHFGLYWETIRPDFPNASDNAPLAPIVEPIGQSMSLVFQLGDLPPLRRVLYLSKHGRRIIQLQEDRFHYNWKIVEPGDSYPGYDVIFADFQKHLVNFETFVRGADIGELSYRQFELTYVNHVLPEGDDEDVDLSSVLIDHVSHASAERFLPKADAINWATSYALPNSHGRLHIVAQTALERSTQRRLLRVDMTARGIPVGNSKEGLASWFGVGHDWITNGFVDSTSDQCHKVWGRTA